MHKMHENTASVKYKGSLQFLLQDAYPNFVEARCVMQTWNTVDFSM